MDPLVVKQRLAIIENCLEQLAQISDRDDFPEDKLISAAAESNLRRSLEAIFDIGRHILAKNGGVELAAEYKSIARGLGAKNIVSAELAETLVSMAGYRNRLVHLYHMVSEHELYEIVTTDLGDLQRFVREIKNYLAR